MANFTALKTAIQNAIKQNGNEEITGDVLQQILLSIVSTMGDGSINTIEQNLSQETLARQNADTQLQSNINAEALARGNADTQLQNAINAIKADIDNGYVYAGIATPSSTPVSGKVFYIATAAGTYTNFGGQVLTQGINILRFNGSAWSNQQLIGIDDVPTVGSNSLVKSGGVQNELALGAVYDVSAKNPTAGPNNDGKWESLSALLSDANLNTLIPTAYRKGGMSIKFVHTSDNKYIQYRLTADEWSIDTEDWAIAEEGVYVENPEFAYVKTDTEDKILWAIKKDGSIYYGAGVPPQIIDYIERKISLLSLDEYEDIVAFLSDYLGSDTTLKVMIDGINAQIATKVDKVEGKSLIDADYASSQLAIDNPEYLQVTADSEDKVLEGIRKDGTKVVGGDLEVGGSANIEDDIRVLGNMEVSGVSYKVIENTEYLAAWVDAKDKVLFGLKADGKTYVGDADFLNDIKDNQKAIAEIKTTLATIGAKVDFLDIDALSSITAVENPEFIEAKTDSEGKLLAGRTSDGKAFENVGFSTTNLEVAGINITNNAEAIACNTAIEDIEGRSEITTDSEGKVISYRDANGVKHEEVGVRSKNIVLPDNALEQSYDYNKNHVQLKNWHYPKFGKVNIKEETFYLTANPSYSTKNDVVCIQVRDSTAGTDPASYYYIKSTLTPLPSGGYDNTSINENSVRLDFYIAKDCTEVDGRYYVKSTLVDGQVVPESIEVIQIKDVPPYKAWAVNKDKHYCVADIDFGSFYNKTNVPIELSYQGNSTMVVNKKGFRLTFYKKNDYKKKDKVKIGEWLRLSGYNLKSYVTDSSRLKSAINYALIYEIWTSRDKDDFPWNNKNNVYNGATGCIEEFPIETWFGDEFFGLQFFGIKKDEKNYLLDGDDDSSGIFVNGDFNNQTTWINANASHWSDELGVEGRELAYPQKGDDSVSVETANAMNEFFKYTKGFITGEIEIEGETVPFENSMLEERIDLASWIDYWIGLQVFLLWDNIYGNIVLYAGRDKNKFYPFFYDVDQALTTVMGPYVDLTDLCQDPTYHPASVPTDVSFWVKFKDEYKDNIINRYTELRKTILSNKNIENIYQTIISEIPESVNNAEKQKWGGDINNYKNVLKFFELRLEWLDNSQFNL